MIAVGDLSQNVFDGAAAARVRLTTTIESR
jgi:hypothetical protein